MIKDTLFPCKVPTCYYLSAPGVLAVMSLSSCYIGSLTLLALPSGPRGGLEALSKVFCAGGVACAGHREENLWPLPAPQASPGGREGLGLNCRVWSLIASALSPAFGGGVLPPLKRTGFQEGNERSHHLGLSPEG